MVSTTSPTANPSPWRTMNTSSHSWPAWSSSSYSAGSPSWVPKITERLARMAEASTSSNPSRGARTFQCPAQPASSGSRTTRPPGGGTPSASPTRKTSAPSRPRAARNRTARPSGPRPTEIPPNHHTARHNRRPASPSTPNSPTSGLLAGRSPMRYAASAPAGEGSSGRAGKPADSSTISLMRASATTSAAGLTAALDRSADPASTSSGRIATNDAFSNKPLTACRTLPAACSGQPANPRRSESSHCFTNGSSNTSAA